MFLLRLHPRRFRDRFGAEMLSIYDELAGRRCAGMLLADAVGSLFRQWVLRRDPEPQPAPAEGPNICCLLENDAPRRAALANGFVCALAAFCLLVFAMSHAGYARLRSYSRTFAIGGAGMWQPSSSAPASAYTVPDTLAPPAPNERRIPRLGALVIRALDRDCDGVISAAEIADAPAALHQEFSAPPSPRPAQVRAARPVEVPIEFFLGRSRVHIAFGRGEPVRMRLLDALDANHDGVLSESEMANAAAVLEALDTNGDGMLTDGEILGYQM